MEQLTQKTMEVQEFIDSQPLSTTQKLVFLLCGIVVAIDGMDTAAVGFIAPALKQVWQLKPTDLSPLFGAGFLGLMAGSMLVGPLGDKIGRKPILLISMLIFSVLNLASAFSPNVTVLTVLRFLTGLGLGGVLPVAIALTSEYAPTKRRSTYINLMFAGLSLGAALGGVLAAQLLETVKWQGILIIGGVLPLILLPFLWWWLPESLRFLVLANRDKATIEKTARRIMPSPNLPVPTFSFTQQQQQRAKLGELFATKYRFGTVLLWVAFFMSLLVIYLVSSWLPTLLNTAGLDLKSASWIATAFKFGGTIGAICLGFLMDKFGASRMLIFSYGIGSALLMLASFGMETGFVALLVVGILGSGMGVSGSQVGANAFGSSFYPAQIRATGISWANAAGRLGAILGSVSGGWLIANLSASQIIGFLALPAAIAAFCFFLITRQQARANHQIH